MIYCECLQCFYNSDGYCNNTTLTIDEYGECECMSIVYDNEEEKDDETD